MADPSKLKTQAWSSSDDSDREIDQKKAKFANNQTTLISIPKEEQTSTVTPEKNNQDWSSDSDSDKEIYSRARTVVNDLKPLVATPIVKIAQTRAVSQVQSNQTRRISTQQKKLRETGSRRKSSVSEMDENITKYLTGFTSTQDVVPEESESSSDSDKWDQAKEKQGIAQRDRSAPLQRRNFAINKSDQKKEDISSVKVEEVKKDILEIIKSSELQNQTDFESEVIINSIILSASASLMELKGKNLRVDQLKLLQQFLSNQKNKYYSNVTSIASYGKYLFAGCESGLIRVINMESQPLEDLKPLRIINKNQLKSPITTIDVSPGMLYLLSGHQNGMLLLWDIKKFKLLVQIKDDAIHDSEIRAAKFYSINDENTIGIISVEAKGPVRRIEIDKNSSFLSLGSKSYSSQTVYMRRLKNPDSIVVNLPTEIRQQDYWQEQQLVALVAQSEVIAACMKSVSEVFKLKRPSMCKSESLPSASFGYGSLASKPNARYLLLAVAWDILIQIVKFDDFTLEASLDGIYYSDSAVEYLQFTAESTLMAWTDRGPIKLIDTKRLKEGDYRQIEDSMKENTQFNPMILEIIDHSAMAEITQEATQRVVNVRSKIREGPDGERVVSYANFIVTFTRQIYFLDFGSSLITRLSTRSFEEYFRLIDSEDQCSWINNLQTAVLIYKGTMQGFFNVPGDLNQRRKEMINFMQDYLVLNLDRAVQEIEYMSSSEKCVEYGIIKQDLQLTAARAATDFCLIIENHNFLFSDIYTLFQESGYEKTFVRCIADFFKSGQLRNVVMSDGFIRRIIQYYESESEFDQIERTVLQANLVSYSFIDELLSLCQNHGLFRAQSHILLSKCRSKDPNFSFFTALQNFQQMMRSAKERELERKKLEQDRFQIVKMSDLMWIDRTTQSLKIQQERSYMYLGYKLLWILDQLINGKLGLFENHLSEVEWRNATYDVAKFILQDEFLNEILQFDAKKFFTIISQLFQVEQSFKYLAEINLYRPSERIQQVFKVILAKVEQFKNQYHKTDSSDDYFNFILNVTSNQEQIVKLVDYNIVMQALKNQIEYISKNVTDDKKQAQSLAVAQEKLIVGTLRNIQITSEDVDELIRICNSQPEQRNFLNIKVALFEIRKDYAQAFKCLLQSVTEQHKIFYWLQTIFIKLQKSNENNQDINELKIATKMHMRELIQLEISLNSKKNEEYITVEDKEQILKMQSQTGADLLNPELSCPLCLFFIQRHFDDNEYITQLVIQELAPFLKQQMSFLKTLVIMREQQISQVIIESVYSPELKTTAQFYNKLLVIMTHRLCEFETDDALFEKWIDKDYLPTRECMEVCRERSKTAGQAILINKIGDGMQSIRLYNQVLAKLDTKRITDQLQLINKGDWDFGRVKGFNILGRFDQILERTYKIAGTMEKDGYRFVYGEEGWFLILEFLQKIFVEAESKMKEAKVEESSKIERLSKIRNFYSMRISYVLKRDDIKLSLRSVADRLSLHYDQIKNLCIDSHSKLKGDRARNLGCIKIQQKDLYGMFTEFDGAYVS